MCSVARNHSISIPLSCVNSILHIETIFNSSFFSSFKILIIIRLGQYQRKPETDTYEPEPIKTVEGVKIKYIKNRQQLCWGCSEVETCFLTDLNETVFRNMIIFFWLILLLVASGLRINFILWSMAEGYIKLKEAPKGKMGNRAKGKSAY